MPPGLRRPALIGALVTLGVALALFTRFSIDDRLSRDEAVYSYAAQQLVAGVPPYQSIFDPKLPLPAMLGAVGVEGAKIAGGNQVHGIRVVFLSLACAAAAGMYLLALWLWESVLAGVLSAAAFVGFRGFAYDAIGGPDAKTPGIAFGVLSMALLVRRRWFWGGLLAGLAFVCWQPFAAYAIAAVLAAVALSDRGSRLRAAGRALAGALLPIACITVYLAIAGALRQFADATVGFALTGVQRGEESFGQRLGVIARVVQERYDVLHGWLLWGGLIALVVLLALTLWRGRRALGTLVRNPLVCIVAPSGILLAAFTLQDFQGYPDVYPLLPYGALGVGALSLLARGGRRRARWASALGAGLAAALVVVTWVDYVGTPPSLVDLHVQQARVATIQTLLGPRGNLYALGDPTSLVLLHRRNPDRYIYLGSGVLPWKLHRQPGGFAAWLAQIRAADPQVIVINTYSPTDAQQLAFLRSLKQGYTTKWLEGWQLLVRAYGSRPPRRSDSPPAASSSASPASTKPTVSSRRSVRLPSLEPRLL
jgi:hypothetical protein